MPDTINASGIDDKLWNDFKIKCIKEGTTVSSKTGDLIREWTYNEKR